MPRYAMLILPSANRVYAGAAADLVRAELAASSAGALSGSLSDATAADCGGAPYLEFTPPELGERITAFLANIACIQSTLSLTGGSGTASTRPSSGTSSSSGSRSASAGVADTPRHRLP